MIQFLFCKIKKIISNLNSYGVELPMFRVDGKASLTATMTIISFNSALLGQLGKISGFLGGIDLTQSNYLFGICLAAYLGRKFQTSGKDVTLDKKSGEEKAD